MCIKNGELHLILFLCCYIFYRLKDTVLPLHGLPAHPPSSVCESNVSKQNLTWDNGRLTCKLMVRCKFTQWIACWPLCFLQSGLIPSSYSLFQSLTRWPTLSRYFSSTHCLQFCRPIFNLPVFYLSLLSLHFCLQKNTKALDILSRYLSPCNSIVASHIIRRPSIQDSS